MECVALVVLRPTWNLTLADIELMMYVCSLKRMQEECVLILHCVFSVEILRPGVGKERPCLGNNRKVLGPMLHYVSLRPCEAKQARQLRIV